MPVPTGTPQVQPSPPTPPEDLPPSLSASPKPTPQPLVTEPGSGAVAYASPTTSTSAAGAAINGVNKATAEHGAEADAPSDDACFMLDVVNTHAHRAKVKRRKTWPRESTSQQQLTPAASPAAAKPAPAALTPLVGAAPPSKPGTATPDSEYEYVPVLDQTDAQLAQKAEARALLPGSFRLAPIKLVFQDLGTFARNASLLRVVESPQLEYKWPQVGWSSTLGSWAMVGASVPLTLLAAAGAVACLPAIAGLYAFAWTAEKVQGAPVRESKRLDNGADVPGHEREKWFFVNGIATPPRQAQISVDFLHTLTGRPVTALLNRTLGVWFDLWECLLQRDLHQATADIRDGYRVGRVGLHQRVQC